jgi:hypothetical protein
VLGHDFWLDDLEAVEQARDRRRGARVDPLGGLVVDLERALRRVLVAHAARGDVAHDQVAARRDRVPDRGDDPGRIVLVGDEMQDRQEDHRNRPAEVEMVRDLGIR